MDSFVPDGYALRSGPAGTAIVRADLAHVPLERFWAAGTALADAKGRGSVQILEVAPGLSVVARDYRRGGALRALLPDRFFGKERAYRELATLCALRAAGVLAVEPIAALAQGSGPLTRLRLCTRLLADALPLPLFVARQPHRRREAIRAAGRVVAAAFACGLRHPDLHPDNLLVLASARPLRVELVDLDRAMLRPPLRPRDRDAMLLRMARYLVRHRLPHSRADLLRFVLAFGLTVADFARLGPPLARMIARHQLTWRS